MVNFNSISFNSKITYILICIQFAMSISGIVTNILAICVFSRKSLRIYSYSFYCRIKAASDILISVYIIRNWTLFIMDFDIDGTTEFLCILNKCLAQIAGMLSLGMLVVISLDRLLLVMYPNRFGVLKKRWFQLIAVFSVIVYSCCLNLVLPLNTQYVVSQVGNQTVRSCVVPSNTTLTHSWIRNCNILVIILIINNALNIRLITYIIASRRKVASNATQNRSGSKDRKMIICAISVGFAALICKLPLGTAQLINIYLRIPSDLSSLILNCCITVMSIEYSAMFFVNIFLNTSFYIEFLNMFGLKREEFTSNTGNNRSNTNKTNVDT